MTNKDLQAFLNRHGLYLNEFATLLGVTDMAVTHWLGGKRSISLTVTRLCKLFDRHPHLMGEFKT